MAAKDSGGSMFGWLLIAAGAYVAYELFFASSTSAAASSVPPPAPTAGGSTPATSAPPAASPAQPAFNSLDQIYQRLAQTVQQNSTDPALSQVQGQWQAVPDVFNYYLGKISSYQLSGTAMGQLFGPEPQAALSLAAFWSAASGWLAQNKGLSGIGGRGFAGIIARGRR